METDLFPVELSTLLSLDDLEDTTLVVDVSSSVIVPMAEAELPS